MLRDRFLSFGQTLLLVPGLTLPAFAQTSDPAVSQTSDPIVTSDTPEYCDVLMDRITGLSRAAGMPPPVEVAALSQEGERMCVHGQTRGGILRLRKALALIRHGED